MIDEGYCMLCRGWFPLDHGLLPRHDLAVRQDFEPITTDWSDNTSVLDAEEITYVREVCRGSGSLPHDQRGMRPGREYVLDCLIASRGWQNPSELPLAVAAYKGFLITFELRAAELCAVARPPPGFPAPEGKTMIACPVWDLTATSQTPSNPKGLRGRLGDLLTLIDNEGGEDG